MATDFPDWYQAELNEGAEVPQSSQTNANALLSASAANKGNHRWKDNVCIHCGCKRTKKTFKYLMAITDFSPYYHYLYEQGYVYETGEQTTIERPFCPGRSSSR